MGIMLDSRCLLEVGASVYDGIITVGDGCSSFVGISYCIVVVTEVSVNGATTDSRSGDWASLTGESERGVTLFRLGSLD
jgi:hypothetical protein